MALGAPPGAVLAISVDTQGGLARVASAIGRMPQAAERAMTRALNKLSTWLKRRALQAASEASAIPQKFFVRAVRYHIKIQKQGSQVTGLALWLGTNPIKVHRLGVVRWTRAMKGARVGKRSFPGAWSWGHGKTGKAVMFRHGSSRLPIGVETVTPHDPILARLRGIEGEANARFERLLTQELNYALNHEAAR